MKKIKLIMLSRQIFWLWLILISIVAQPTSADETYMDIQPILALRCVMCHSGDAAPLDLRLDSYEAVLTGSSRGPVLISGDPSGSEIIRRLKGLKQPRMPMTGPPFLSDSEIALFERWIASGMPKGDAEDKTTTSNLTTLQSTAGQPVTYLHVAPVFAMRCTKCHAEKGLMGPAPEGYRLTSHAETLSGNERVRVIPGQPRASELVRRIRGWSLPRMPFDGPPFLSEDEIQLIEKWIAQGARDASGKPAAVPAGAEVRLQGVLDGRWQLDGLPLQIGPWTRIKKSPSAGDFVEVRGVVLGDGGIRVLRLRRR